MLHRSMLGKERLVEMLAYLLNRCRDPKHGIINRDHYMYM